MLFNVHIAQCLSLEAWHIAQCIEGEIMAYEKVKYNNEYNKQSYERLNIQVKKGQKAIIEEYRKSKGYSSLNSYINHLIYKDMGISENKQNINIENNHGIIMGDNQGTINM